MQNAAENITAEAVLSRIKRLMARQELQEALRVSESTMVAWEREGKLPPSFKLGRCYFYDPADIHDWLESNRSR